MKKLILFLTLISTLLSCVTLPLSADAWFPPDELANEYIMNMYYQDRECEAINVFLSNYIETGVTAYDGGTSDRVVVDSMLKHFELNAAAYGGSVKSGTSAHGKYMRIKASEFEGRTKVLYNRSIGASSVEGYSDGWIYASADNYNAPITCFAAAKSMDYMGNGVYQTEFEIFNSTKDVKNLYGKSYSNLKSVSYLTSLGEGTCNFICEKANSTNLKPSDFKLISIHNGGRNIPYSEPCVPCDDQGMRVNVDVDIDLPQTTTPAPETTVPQTSAIPETQGTTADTYEPFSQEETTEPAETKETEESKDNMIILITATAIVAVVAIIAVVIIALAIIKNKTK